MEPTPNKYQLAGVDDQDRGFNRQAEMQNRDGQFQAIFRYEKFLLEAEIHATEPAALASLIKQLHNRGYTQLRTRLHFRGKEYLGNQEIWDEHQDPETRSLFQQMMECIRGIWHRTRG